MDDSHTSVQCGIGESHACAELFTMELQSNSIVYRVVVDKFIQNTVKFKKYCFCYFIWIKYNIKDVPLFFKLS